LGKSPKDFKGYTENNLEATMNFIDELLAESEVKDKENLLQMNKVRADQILLTLAVLEQQAEEVNSIVEAELKILEEYRTAELCKIEKKASWLEYQLEQFMRSTDDKTINLPHGSLKLRMGRDKVEIIDMEKFLPFAKRKDLLRHVPEKEEPDMIKILNYLKSGTIPGVAVISATTKFSYTTIEGNNNGNGKELSTESRSENE
jgi:phage host-nuclease inhibitor protein Gam